MTPSDLSPEVRRLYAEYGDALHQIGPDFFRAKAFAREVGCTEWSARKLKAAVVDLGPPSERDDLEGAVVLVVPDAHAAPHQDLRRFTWLGRAIEHYGRVAMKRGVPFRVVIIGDFGDFRSLSSYDTGKGSSWGENYEDDVKAVQDALALTREGVSDAVWDYADKHYTEGNHEHRATRWMQDNPTLQGTLTGCWDAMQDYDIKPHAYGEIVRLDGVGYCHIQQGLGSSRPIGGVHQAHNMIQKGQVSMVVGHSHKLDSKVAHRLDGTTIRATVVGCFFEHDESYAGQGNRTWWRGLVVLENVRNGNYDQTDLRIDTVRIRFGEGT
jgi:hypothetical protein